MLYNQVGYRLSMFLGQRSGGTDTPLSILEGREYPLFLNLFYRLVIWGGGHSTANVWLACIWLLLLFHYITSA